MATIEIIIDKLLQYVFAMMNKHGAIVGLLAFLGLMSIIGAVINKTWQCLKYLFMFVVAIPAVIIVGLLNKSEREARKKELGEIVAHMKVNPEKWKRILYYFLFIVFIAIILWVLLWVVQHFVIPFSALNDYTKGMLENQTNVTL